ncbi:hypothetical protein CC2G_000829 [Coprinopsis cinerea AmutBmut pab1-1]|nr:hypothetical protein CC2G_000829 [Coprinopsis cinerea AmutBmut pab1-1]
MESLITSYFPRAKGKKKQTTSKRKRTTASEHSNDAESSSIPSTKRSKSDTPKSSRKTVVPSSSQGRTRKDVIVVSDDIDTAEDIVKVVAVTHTPRDKRVNSITIGSSYSRANRKPDLRVAVPSANIEETPSQPDSDSPLTPLPADYLSDPIRASPPKPGAMSDSQRLAPKLTRSMQHHVDFSTPRTKRILAPDSDGDDEMDLGIRSPHFIGSSQTQYYSPVKVSPLKPVRQQVTLLEDDFIESSQTQERELDYPFYHPPQHKLRFTSETPEPTGALSNTSSFSQELPVRNMTLGGSDAAPHREAEPEPDLATPTSSQQQCFMSSLPPSSCPDDDYSSRGSQLDALNRSPSPLHEPCEDEFLAGNSQTEHSESGDETPLPPSSSPFKSPYSDERDEPSASPSSQYPYPSQIHSIYKMFEGEESYPPDFPMSLRV